MKTQILRILKQNKISVYRFVKEMGFEPKMYQGRWTGRLQGIYVLTKEEKELVEKTLHRLTENKFVDIILIGVDKYRCL